jgi:hypothetical protein
LCWAQFSSAEGEYDYRGRSLKEGTFILEMESRSRVRTNIEQWDYILNPHDENMTVRHANARRCMTAEMEKYESTCPNRYLWEECWKPVENNSVWREYISNIFCFVGISRE